MCARVEIPYQPGGLTAVLHAGRCARACPVGPSLVADMLRGGDGAPSLVELHRAGCAHCAKYNCCVRIIVVCATIAAAPWNPSSSSWLWPHAARAVKSCACTGTEIQKSALAS